ncbi:MAG: TylF/MycF/NovP-related O-methyltransferase [Candidatus Sulfotelmatobacter sp.]
MSGTTIGLPRPVGIDADESQRYEPGEYACDVDQFRRNVEVGGVDLRNVRCIAGWYDKTLTPTLKQELGIEKASIILIDCDLYESTVPVLNFITDYIQTGTVLIFDDWYSYKGRLDRGEAKAFVEWLKLNPRIQANEYHKCGRTMMSFILQVD